MLDRIRRLGRYARERGRMPRSPRSPLPPGVGGPLEARRVLELERDRAARSEQPISVVVFFEPSARGDDELLGRLADELHLEVRKVDCIVSFDSVHISVVLPDTPSDGAAVFGDRVLENLAERGITARFGVHSEPLDQAGDGDVPGGFAPLVGDGTPTAKRVSDLVGGLGALLLATPIMVAIALYIRIVSPGPVFFRQQRVGLMGRPFTMLKFRTMHVNADQGEHESHVKRLIRDGRPMEKLDAGRDPRIIPGGHFLRRTCLDELPQLINVLRGEMSLIGPRPEVPYATDAYSRWHRLRFNTIPGMTGLWQVERGRATTFDEMARLDISYASERSTLLDLAILLSTLPIVLFGRNGRAL